MFHLSAAWLNCPPIWSPKAFLTFTSWDMGYPGVWSIEMLTAQLAETDLSSLRALAAYGVHAREEMGVPATP